MQKFEFLRQPLMGELAMSRKKKREIEKNAIYSGHLRLCQQPSAAHAMRSDQKCHLQWPPTFMPAAKGSARTPLGRISDLFDTLN